MSLTKSLSKGLSRSLSKGLLARAAPLLSTLLLAGGVMAADIERVTGENIPALGPYVPATVFNGVVYTSGQIAVDASADNRPWRGVGQGCFG